MRNSGSGAFRPKLTQVSKGNQSPVFRPLSAVLNSKRGSNGAVENVLDRCAVAAIQIPSNNNQLVCLPQNATHLPELALHKALGGVLGPAAKAALARRIPAVRRHDAVAFGLDELVKRGIQIVHYYLHHCSFCSQGATRCLSAYAIVVSMIYCNKENAPRFVFGVAKTSYRNACLRQSPSKAYRRSTTMVTVHTPPGPAPSQQSALRSLRSPTS